MHWSHIPDTASLQCCLSWKAWLYSGSLSCSLHSLGSLGLREPKLRKSSVVLSGEKRWRPNMESNQNEPCSRPLHSGMLDARIKHYTWWMYWFENSRCALEEMRAADILAPRLTIAKDFQFNGTSMFNDPARLLESLCLADVIFRIRLTEENLCAGSTLLMMAVSKSVVYLKLVECPITPAKDP